MPQILTFWVADRAVHTQRAGACVPQHLKDRNPNPPKANTNTKKTIHPTNKTRVLPCLMLLSLQ